MSPILSVRNLSRNFGAIKAVDDVSFDLATVSYTHLTLPTICSV